MQVSDVENALIEKAAEQRKVFKYLEVNPNDIVVDRKMTEDEVEQFYNDFSAEFTVPESRNITVLEVGFDDIAKKVEVSEDEIKEFYNQNVDKFVKPETREVLQMLFDNEQDAQKAMEKLESGNDFYQTAMEMLNQSQEDTSLGMVSKDMLIEELSQKAFEAQKGEVLGPIESKMGWHVIEVNKINPSSKVDDSVAHKQIEDSLRTEKAYEEACF